MTDPLQPNDCVLNKTMKDNSQGKINELVKANEEILRVELVSIILSSLQCENIAPSVRKSFKYTGIFPFEPLQMLVILKDSLVKDLTKEDE
jgi:hypothetical protein